jgi:hypothetical protein
MEKVKECLWRRIAVFAFIFYLLLGFGPETWAGGLNYWAADGVPIVTATGDQDGPVTTSDGGSGAIMVWSDQRSGSGSYAVYAQRIDSNGNPLWASNGVAIYTGATVGSASPRLATDEVGGAIIIWADTRGGNNSLYAQRVNGSGQLLWNPSGVLITNSIYVTDDSGQYRLISDGSGGAIICWQDGRDFATSERNIYAQRIDTNGNIQWAANGVAIVTAARQQRNPRMDDDGAGGAIIAWQDYRNAEFYRAYIQRISNSGVVQWAANGINLTPSSHSQGIPLPTSDNKGGVYIFWRDLRGGLYKIYAQHVDNNGNQLWAGGGVSVSGTVGNSSTYTVYNDIFGEPYVAWRDISSAGSSYSTTGLFAQKINDAGTGLWGATGIHVSTAPINPSSSSYNLSMGENNGGGVIVTWDDFRNGNWDIYAQEVDAAGNMLWNANGMALCTAPNDQQEPSIRAFNNGIIVGWSDARNSGVSGYDIYAQRVASGERYFSHFDATEGAWWTGIALANTNSSLANVTLTAYNQSGALIGNSNITVPANGQNSFQAKDQLGVSGTGWIQIVPDKQINGLEIFGNIASGSLAGLGLSRKPSSNFGFSHFDTTADWWTGIALANPHTTQAHVTLTAYNQSGTQIGSSTITLPANGQNAFQVNNQLGVSGTGWIRVVSDQPVVGLEIFGNIHTGQITGVPASTYPSTILYVPHFDTTAAWWTGVALANPNGASATVTLTAYNQSGIQIGTSTITLPANGQKAFQVNSQLGVSGTVGWIRVESDQPLVGLEILGSVTSGGVAGLVAPNYVRHNLAFSHFDTTADWWTGIALVNPNGTSATVTLNAYNQSGAGIGNSTIILPANGQNFFQVKDQLGVSGTGWINVSSDQPLAGLELFGNVATGQITGIGGGVP